MATTVQAITGTYELDPTHSTVQFSVRHVDVSVFRGSFSEIDATLTTANGRASFNGEVHVESISIGDPRRCAITSFGVPTSSTRARIRRSASVRPVWSSRTTGGPGSQVTSRSSGSEFR
jgi:hypothetical protein